MATVTLGLMLIAFALGFLLGGFLSGELKLKTWFNTAAVVALVGTFVIALVVVVTASAVVTYKLLH